MRGFAEIQAFEEAFELFSLPRIRVIGKEVRNGGALGNTAPALWDEVFSSGAYEVLKGLPQMLEDANYGWTCEYDAKTDTFVYMVCAITPENTPVPEGFTYRDYPETVCAKGLYGESVMQTVERAKELGYVPNWKLCGWNAELYLDAEEKKPPKACAQPWHWLVPVKKKEE